MWSPSPIAPPGWNDDSPGARGVRRARRRRRRAGAATGRWPGVGATSYGLSASAPTTAARWAATMPARSRTRPSVERSASSAPSWARSLTPRSGSSCSSSAPASGDADGVAAAQARQAPRLGERAEDEQARVLARAAAGSRRPPGRPRSPRGPRPRTRQHARAAIGAVRPAPRRCSSSPVGSFGLQMHDDARAVVDRPQQRLGAPAGHRHRAPVRAPGHDRIERVARPRGDELVAGLEQRGGRRVQELRGAVADDDLLGLQAVVVGELGPQRAGARVDVAVQALARRVRDRVDDVVVRAARATSCARGRPARRSRAPWPCARPRRCAGRR